tara:strand:+ start:1179 stop:1586 length:408 start_codon:yes stop_codon:yes gene_type:complete
MSTILRTFNNHYVEFLEDVMSIYPDDLDLKTFYTFFIQLKRINPIFVITVWKTNIIPKYGEQIMKGDIDFFKNKDYDEDVTVLNNYMSNMKKSMDMINKIKENFCTSSIENQKKAMKYVQNLNKLCILYFKSKTK